MTADYLPSDHAATGPAGRVIGASPGMVIPCPTVAPGILTQRGRLRIRQEPCREIAAGRGFWDPHSEVVEYHIIPHGSFHSYLESETLRIDIDAQGVPVFVELALLGVKLLRDNSLIQPQTPEVAVHRFLDFPIGFAPPLVRANRDNSLFHIQISGDLPTRRWMYSRGAIWEGDDRGFLSGVWLAGIVNDPSERHRMAWRAASWRSWRQRHAATGALRTEGLARPISTRQTV